MPRFKSLKMPYEAVITFFSLDEGNVGNTDILLDSFYLNAWINGPHSIAQYSHHTPDMLKLGFSCILTRK